MREYIFIFRTNHTLSSHVHRKLKFKLTQIQMLFSVHANLAFIKELFIRSRISPVSENVRLIFVCISLFINIPAIEAGLPSFVLSFRAIQCLKLSKLRNDRNPLIPASGLGIFSCRLARYLASFKRHVALSYKQLFKADFHSVQNVARLTFSERFLLNYKQSSGTNLISCG